MFVNQNSKAGISQPSYDLGLRKYLVSIYNYMATALAVTGLVAYTASSSDAFMQMMFGSAFSFVVALAPLVFVMVISSKIQSMSLQSAQICLGLFAVLMGLSLSYIFIIYTGGSIARVFFITAVLFSSMALYGNTTKKDLTAMGSFFMMGIFGIVIASVVNLFLQSSALMFATSILGVILFTGITAYDAQRLKDAYYQLASMDEARSKVAIMGALSLYCNFINIFISLLHLMGERR